MELNEEKKRLDRCIERVLELEVDIELVESTVSGKGGAAFLRVFIHKPGGVTVDDCVRINRRLSRELEYDEELQGAYAVEVSSPGLDRKLHTRRDFERVVGEVLQLDVVDEEGKVRTVRGMLTQVDEETLLMEPAPENSGKGGRRRESEPFRVPLSTVREGKIEVIL